MKTVLFFIVLSLPNISRGQDVKKIKNQTLFDYEQYFVMKDDKKIKQGKYYKLTQFKEDTLISGNYDQNKKNGIWKYFERGSLLAQGKFDSDKKIGVWDYFENSKLITKYNHSSDSILYQSSKSKLERPPVYPDFYPVIYEKMVYPMAALRMGVMGNVTASFVVTKEGTAEDFKLENGIGADCDKELLDALKIVNKNWSPGILNGEKIAVRIFVIAEFKLFDNGDKAIIVRKLL